MAWFPERDVICCDCQQVFRSPAKNALRCPACRSINVRNKRVTRTAERRRERRALKAQQIGQGLVEYALILVLVAVTVIIILAFLGPAVGNIFSDIYVGL
jgi:pilus assembly protein Flp/PilA